MGKNADEKQADFQFSIKILIGKVKLFFNNPKKLHSQAFTFRIDKDIRRDTCAQLLVKDLDF